MPSLDFLEVLSKKLKTGNKRSIHLNALPSRYATRLDITNLNVLNQNNQNQLNLLDNNKESSFAEYFLEELLTKSNFNFPISFDNIDINSEDEDENQHLYIKRFQIKEC